MFATGTNVNETNKEGISVQFVREVKKHPALYNNTIPDFAKRDVVASAWKEVGQNFDITGKK